MFEVVTTFRTEFTVERLLRRDRGVSDHLLIEIGNRTLNLCLEVYDPNS